MPQSNLQYPAAAALSNPSNNAGPFSTPRSSSGIFLSPTVNDTHQTHYSPERVPLSTAQATSRGRQGSNNSSRHHDRYHHQPLWNNHSLSDPEKAIHSQHSPSDSHRPGHNHSSYVSEDEEVIQEHAVWILVRLVPTISSLQSIPSNDFFLNQVYLSFFSPAVASLVSIYSLFTSLFLLLFSPITVFVRPRKPLAFQLHTLLTPPIYYQLRFVCSTYRSDLHHGNSINSEDEHQVTNRSNPVLLTLINVLSPVYAAGIAVTAWVAAGFWFTALILGDPDGRDKKDDGRTVVLGVRRLWERWLVRGLRR